MHLPVPEGDKDESADSGPAPPHMIQSDDYTLFTELSRPMPDYALEHVFAQHGPIEWVSSTHACLCFFLSGKPWHRGTHGTSHYRSRAGLGVVWWLNTGGD